ncbi:MAG: hypothetical protein B6A08_14610 [Sorangiineae bacterium NIC37A_2]|nr:MAG: hypothetical protein B6A08_14610 [Sorangiineae bacterium NIC37A_2]
MKDSYRPPEYPRREPSFEGLTTRELGMNIALASFSVLFLATLIACLVIRSETDNWRNAETPGLPLGLGLSTLLLVVLSAVLYRADRLLLRNAVDSFRFHLQAALGLGLVFLVTQGANTMSVLLGASLEGVRTLAIYSFFLLTGLHALHVLGGVVALLFLTGAREYSSSKREGVVLVRRYWDFLLAVWLVMMAAFAIF